MFFILSKTLVFILLPSNFLLLLALAGVVLLATRWRRAGLRMVVGAVVLLAILGLLPVGTFSIHVLESRFPRWDAARGAPDGRAYPHRYPNASSAVDVFSLKPD